MPRVSWKGRWKVLRFCRILYWHWRRVLYAKGALVMKRAQGLPAGGVGPDRVFSEDDFRNEAADWLPWFGIENRKRLQDMFSGWKNLTEKYECSIGNISTGWTLGQPGVTHVLLGSRNAQQAISDDYAGSLRLEKEDMKRFDADLIGLGPAT